MKDLLEYIVKNLVSEPDAVVIDETKDNGNVDLILTVSPADMGLIIGKGGQTIHSIRKILTVRAIAENVRVNLQLSEPAGGSRPQPANEEAEETTDEGSAPEPAAQTEETETESAKEEKSNKENNDETKNERQEADTEETNPTEK